MDLSQAHSSDRSILWTICDNSLFSKQKYLSEVANLCLFSMNTICLAACPKNYNRPKNGPVTGPFFGQVGSSDNLGQFTVFDAERSSEVAN